MGQPGYEPERAAFIGAIMLSEAEDGMKREKPLSYRHTRWQRVHEEALRLFTAYDPQINKGTVYQTAGRVIDAVNRELAAVDDGLYDEGSW
jgi:hypothetical protein